MRKAKMGLRISNSLEIEKADAGSRRRLNWDEIVFRLPLYCAES